MGLATRPTLTARRDGRSQVLAETESNRLELNQSQQDGHGETSLRSPGGFVRRIDRPVSTAVDLPEGSAQNAAMSLVSRAISRDGTDLARFAVAGALRRLIREPDAGL